MVRSKNKPKKNAAAVSPAEIPTGTTEVIAASAQVASRASCIDNTLIAAEATAPNPTFTQIGMAGMIGMLSTVSSSGKDTPPTVADLAAPNPTDVEQTSATEEPKTEEPKTEEPKLEESKAAESVPVESTGIFGFFRRLYNSLGSAIHR